MASTTAVQPQHPKLILWLEVNPYPGFTGVHRDGVIRNDRGDSAVALGHFQRFGPADSKAPRWRGFNLIEKSTYENFHGNRLDREMLELLRNG